MPLDQAKIAADISFVFDECARFAKMSIAELRVALKDNWHWELPHPSGRGEMTCGREAGIRVIAIAEEVLYLNRLRSRVSLRTMRRMLAAALVQRFIVERRPLDRQQIDRLFSWLGREALRTKCEAKVHFLPCHLMFEEEPSELPVGPVTFRGRRSFRKRILPALRTYGQDRDKWGRDLLTGALRYYRSFKWIAEVAILPADEEMSKAIAERAVMAALNAIHVTLGAHATDEMVIGGPRIHKDERAHICVTAAETLSPSLSFGGPPGQVGFAPGWSKGLPGSDAERDLTLFGIAIEGAANPDVARPLSQRVLDSMYWFGEGVRETSNAAKITKFTVALERLLMTQERDDIARVVSDRCAAFCLVIDARRSLSEWKVDAKKLYDLRSRLVHGDMSPLDTLVSEGANLGAKLARLAILSVLNHFGENGLRAEHVTTKRLARWFDAVVAASEQRDHEVR